MGPSVNNLVTAIHDDHFFFKVQLSSSSGSDFYDFLENTGFKEIRENRDFEGNFRKAAKFEQRGPWT